MWIRKLYQSRIVKNKWLFTLIVFVIPVVIMFIPYVITRFEHLCQYDLATWVSLGFAFSWIYFGPFLINQYFESLDKYQTEIVEASFNTNDLIEDFNSVPTSVEIQRLITEEVVRFKKRLWLFFSLWGTVVVSILLLFNKRLVDFAFMVLRIITIGWPWDILYFCFIYRPLVFLPLL